MILDKNYRNEFFFKNSLFNKLFLKKYSLNTAVAISELKVAKSRPDFIIINNRNSIVYEVKTDLDNLDRLIYQISDYYKVFSYVYIVTTEKYYYPVYKEISKHFKNIGIIVLTTNNQFSYKKKALSNYESLEYISLFKLMRKAEYENLVNHFFTVPNNIRQVDHFDTYLYYFKLLDLSEAQKEVLKIIKKRYQMYPLKDFDLIPKEINWLIYSANISEKEYINILNIYKQRSF